MSGNHPAQSVSKFLRNLLKPFGVSQTSCNIFHDLPECRVRSERRVTRSPKGGGAARSVERKVPRVDSNGSCLVLSPKRLVCGGVLKIPLLGNS